MSEQDPKTNAALSSVSTQQIYVELLRRMGEDPTRDGLLRTPERMEKSMAFLTQGYSQKVEDVIEQRFPISLARILRLGSRFGHKKGH